MPVAKSTGRDFKPVPSGSHIARCMAVIALGTQESPNYPSSFKVMLMFEVPGEVIEIDNKPAPMTIQREYTLSLSEKANLRHDLESWRGRQFTQEELDGFAVEKVLGQPCMLSVIHKTTAKNKLYGAISGISGIPKGVTCPPAWHKPVHFEIDMGSNSDAFKSLPEWIRKKIEACGEWTKPQGDADPEPDVQSEPDESVPFN